MASMSTYTCATYMQIMKFALTNLLFIALVLRHVHALQQNIYLTDVVPNA